MQVNEISKVIIDELNHEFGKCIDNIKILESTDVPHSMLSIEFELFRYFNLRLNYDRGRFGCSIINGNYGIRIDTTEKWFEKANLSKFCNDVRIDVELRIPDKYLERFI